MDGWHDPDAKEGKKLGRFEILTVLGRGGMGVVYLAQDPVIGRQVAIKEIRIEPGVDEGGRDELQARFEQEFRSAGTLTHPNVVTIYDVGETDDACFIAMEYVAGESLAQRLQRERRPSYARVSHLAQQIAAGLDYAHGRGVVHRDVKPGNILLTDDEQAKISDFGIAKFLSSDLTQTGTVLGTPAFMSPEQARGRPVDGRSDQFSFAVILYRMLTGEQPFLADHPSTTLYRIIHDTPKTPRTHNPELPPAVDEVLERGLAKSPDERFDSCRQLARALAEALQVAALPAPGAGQPATVRLPAHDVGVASPERRATPAERERRVAKPLWRRPAFLAAGVVGVILAGGLLVAGGAFERDDAGPVTTPPAGSEAAARNAATAGDEAVVAVELADPPAVATVEHLLEILSSSGDGARIYRDGEDTGLIAPASVPLAGEPGTRLRLELIGEGGTVAERELELAATPPEPWLPDVPRPPLVLRLTSEPSGARVVLDGRELGVTPLDHDFEHGTDHDLRLELDGYRPAGWRFALADLSDAQLRSRRLHFPLGSDVPPGVLEVAAPYAVEAIVGDRRFGPGTALEIPLPPERYRVELVAEDVFLRQTYRVALRSGERRALQAPAAVAVRISAQPSNCTLVIDGRVLDDSMPMTVRLAVGRHAFHFTWPDGRSRRLVETVSPATERLFATPQ